MTTMWPSASLYTTQPSCNSSASSWWWWPGLGGSCKSQSRSFLNELDLLWSQCYWPLHVWFLLTVETCLQWHLQAGNSGGSQQWGPVFTYFCHPSHLLHSYLELFEIPWLWRMAKNPLYMWLPLYSSGSLFWSLYIHLHMSCGHLPCGQVDDYVLCNPLSHVKSYHLHSEKHRKEKKLWGIYWRGESLRVFRLPRKWLFTYIGKVTPVLDCFKKVNKFCRSLMKKKDLYFICGEYLLTDWYLFSILITFKLLCQGFNIHIDSFKIINWNNKLLIQ